MEVVVRHVGDGQRAQLRLQEPAGLVDMRDLELPGEHVEVDDLRQSR